MQSRVKSNVKFTRFFRHFFHFHRVFFFIPVSSLLLNSHVIQLLSSQAITIFHSRCMHACVCALRTFAYSDGIEHTFHCVRACAHEFIARLMTAYHHHQQYLHTPNPCHSFPLDLLAAAHINLLMKYRYTQADKRLCNFESKNKQNFTQFVRLHGFVQVRCPCLDKSLHNHTHHTHIPITNQI